jgi:hypothetical protein
VSGGARCRATWEKNRGGGVRACGPRWAGYSGPSLKNSPPFYYSKFSNRLGLIRLNNDFPLLKNFQIKYVFEAFKIRNNFPHWNFSKFGLGFELKIKEKSRY